MGASPNPNALKFELDTKLAETISFRSADEATAAGSPFAGVLAVDGVVSLFGTNDFVTVTRKGDADWDPVIAAVQAAAADL